MPRSSIQSLFAGKPDLETHFAAMAADPAVSGDGLLAAMQAAGLPAKRSAVFKWRQRYSVAERHRPNSIAGRVASALRSASAEQLATLRLPVANTTAAVFKLGRHRLYSVARQLGLVADAETRSNCAAPSKSVNDERLPPVGQAMAKIGVGVLKKRDLRPLGPIWAAVLLV